jgi:beta-lactam-binding protein with PASTA domain
VPDLVGTDSAAAKLALNRLGLVGRVDLVPATGRPGLVLDVFPTAGEMVPPGTRISLHVPSLQPVPPTVPIPPLLGLDTARVRFVLDSLRLPWRPVPTAIPGHPGVVVSVDPPEGTPFPPATTTTQPVIEVGIPDDASQRVPVPSLIGLDTIRAEARALDSLTALGPVDRSFTFSFRESGGVARQSPEPGTIVPPGTPIYVRLAWRRMSILIVVTGIAFLLALPTFFLVLLRPRKFRTTRHADPNPHMETDPRDPRDGPDIRNRPVLDTGLPSFADDDPPTIVNERRSSDD